MEEEPPGELNGHSAPQIALTENDRSSQAPQPGNHPSTNGKDEASPTAIDVHKIGVTSFEKISAQSLRYGMLTLRELASVITSTTAKTKEDLPLLKLQRFGDQRTDKNCLRSDANVIEIFGIEGEHDAGTMSFTEATEALRKAKLRGIIYTSPSYIPGTKERWRVLLPTSGPLAPGSRTGLVARLNGVVGGMLAPTESFTLSQSFYYGSVNGNPNHQVRILDGDFIDQRPDLDAGAIFKGKTVGGTRIIGRVCRRTEAFGTVGRHHRQYPGRRRPAPQPGCALGQAGGRRDGWPCGREPAARALG